LPCLESFPIAMPDYSSLDSEVYIEADPMIDSPSSPTMVLNQSMLGIVVLSKLLKVLLICLPAAPLWLSQVWSRFFDLVLL